jgi:hypothetical protein
LRRVEDALLAGVLQPRLSGHAVNALAYLGTQKSQQALVDLACRYVNPLKLRQAAGVSFGLNAERYGLLLDRDSIKQQYARYNNSASQDRATQQVLSSILSTIESHAAPSILEAARKAAASQKPVQRKPPPAPKPIELKD